MDHRTLMRAAKDFATAEPRFAMNCGLSALYWMCAGRSYDVTTGDVLTAYELTLRAAEAAQLGKTALEQIRSMLEEFPQERFVKDALARAVQPRRADPAA